MSKVKKSWVWKHFSENGSDLAISRICEKIIARSGRTTSAMSNHLTSQHQLEDPFKKKATGESSTASEQNLTPTSCNTLKLKLTNAAFCSQIL